MAKSSKKAKRDVEEDVKKKKSKKGRTVADDLEESGKKKGKKGKAQLIDDDDAGSGTFDPYAMFQTKLDDIANRHGVNSDLMEDIPPMSTGCLALDLVYGGGIRPAMLVHAGEEQTAKTTGALVAMSAAVAAKVPIVALWDYEGSTRSARRYVANIIRTVSGIKNRYVFGKRNKDTGKWEVRPAVQYFSETRGEKFFNWMAHVLRELPDKRFIKDKWWLVYDDTKENKAKYGPHADSSMPKKYGKGIWLPAPDGNIQALVLLDSLPAMNPPSNDDDEADNSLGVHARFFSKHLPRIKGRLASKMVCLLAVNQLRDIPMAMYGPKQQEPCGKAVRYNSDARLWWASRSSGMPFNPKFDKDEGLEIEKSVELEESNDRYRYVQIKAKKNKLAQPGRKVWVRLWVEDGEGEARGFDPVFDTIQYLQLTGQLVHKRRDKITLNLHKLGEAKSTLNWKILKKWILGDKEEKKRICGKIGYDKPFDLRKFCFAQMESGKGEALYNSFKNATTKGEEDDDAE